MERHALGSQTFVPLGERRFVIVVAPAGEAPITPGTRHHALLAVDAGDFVVIERAAAAVDCDACRLQEPARVVPAGNA
jgi:ureidoglycolate lyase